MPHPKSEQEIDLLALLSKGVSAFRKNFWLIVLSFIIGSGLGLGYFLSAKKVFETKMIVSSTIMTDSYSKVLFQNITKLVNDGSISTLSQKLNIPPAKAMAIASLKITNISQADELKESQRFLITAEVYDQEILPELQAGLINYLENNEYVKIRVDQNKSYMKQMIASMDREIKELENLKTKIGSGEFYQSAKGNVMFDPTSVNSKILEITDKKLTLENNLQLSSSVQLVEGFTRFEKHTRPLLSVSLVSGSIVGLVFVGIFIVFKSLRAMLSRG